MKTARRYIYREIAKALLLTLAAFLALFLFFDLLGEMSSTTRRHNSSYGMGQALWYCLLLLPQRVYELLPITVLIACIFVMASLGQSSEFTILRTSGLGPGRALRTLMGLGILLSGLTFLVGDYIAPYSSQQAQLFRARFAGGSITAGHTGAWLKENVDGNDRILNIRRLSPDGVMQQIRIFDFDRAGRLHTQTRAAQGHFGVGQWQLEDVQRHVVLFPAPATTAATPTTTASTSTAAEDTPHPYLPYLTEQEALVAHTPNISPEWASSSPTPSALPPPDTQPRLLYQHLPSGSLHTGISQHMVAAALLRPERMSAVELFLYARHLKSNGQSARSYEIPFWHKVFYPLSCLVMVVLALPFAYLHFRSGQIASAVFGGVITGVSFFLLNHIFGYIGNLRAWTPWLAAAIPSLFYSALALAAFIWLVRKR